METRNCQNCRKDFTITPDDFGFYEKIKVPPPTFCPWCRFIRRMSWRNNMSLYKRECDLCKKTMIAMYPSDTTFPVYCISCWYGDGWDPSAFAQEYDLARPFFEQWKELFNKVPRFGMWQRNAINSDYSNNVAESKNIYLSVSVTNASEDVFYSKSVDASRGIMDSLNLKNSEQCYENIDGDKNYNSQYLTLSRNCIDSYFLIDCVNCTNCFMSSNLRNKKYYIRNTGYTKEEYFEQINALALGNREARNELILEFKKLSQNAIYKYANIINAVNSSGHNLLNAKNLQHCFDCYSGEDFKYCNRNFTSKDCWDCDFSQTSELMYEYITGGANDYNVRFSYSAMGNVENAEYVHSCFSSKNIFACISLRNKEYAIFNKVYSKEEFRALREKIIEQMNATPYRDKGGREYRYGEFFPTEISPFAINETPAQEFCMLTKEEAVSMYYRWKDQLNKDAVPSIPTQKIPNEVESIEESILEETLGCAHFGECNHSCTGAFRITKGELQFYKLHNIPLPDKCPNCRYFERFSQIPLPKLYRRTCDKCKKIEFDTPYIPSDGKKVYCESCYNKEVY